MDVVGAPSFSRTNAQWCMKALVVIGVDSRTAPAFTAAGEDEAKRLPVEERLHPLVARHVVKRIEIGHLGVAENLQPIPGEVLVEARERQAGTVDDRLLDLPVQVFRARNEREGQRFAAGFVEVGHGEGVALRARTGRKTLHDQFFADAARCLRTVPLRALTRILRS